MLITIKVETGVRIKRDFLILKTGNHFKCCNLHDLIYIFLDNGVTTTPNVVFTVLCFETGDPVEKHAT